MKATEVLEVRRKMEESGMEPPWTDAVLDAILVAIEPLATKADLKTETEALREAIKAGADTRR